MSPPVDPVTRFDHCTSGHRYDPLGVEAHETKSLSGYIHSSWHGNAWIPSQGGFCKSCATLWTLYNVLMENSQKE